MQRRRQGGRGFGMPGRTRSMAAATQGMVATSHPQAVSAGLDILKAGGNAVDAAIAANAMLGVVEPMSCGIGGDLFAIVWDATNQQLSGLNASGRSPLKTSIKYFTDRGEKKIPETGPLSWSVPGCVDGWEELHRRMGTMGLAALLTPAIEAAEKGFVVTEIIGAGWRSTQKLLSATSGAAKCFLKDGKPPAIGAKMTNPMLAKSYRTVAEGGRDAFYKGPIAASLVRYSESVGGLFSVRDFEEHISNWVEPIKTTYRGHEIWELPPNGQGLAALEMLNILEEFDIKGMGHNSADFLHLFLEAKKLAFADRAAYYADPDFAKMPIAELASKEYAAKQRKRIDLKKASLEVAPGDVRFERNDTVYVTVVDKDRNAVSLIQSNYNGWGSGYVPDDLGFPIQNRGALFDLNPKHPNCLAPGKRPFHTIIPAMASKNGVPWLSFGVMGGDMQPQGHVQVLINMLDHGMNIQQAGDAARCRHLGSSTPTGDRMTDGGTVALEPGISQDVRSELESRGHKLGATNESFGGYQAVQIDYTNGTLQGGSDPRKDGLAMGY